jgi:molecular chaperone DnaK
VKARDKGTNKEHSIRIEGSSGLSKEEKERMVREASEHAAEDALKKEAADIRNAAETLVWTTEKMIAENKEKIKEEDVKDLEAKMTDVKTAIQSGDKDNMKSTSETLSSAAQKVGGSLYQSQQEEQKAGTPADTKAEEVKAEEKKE